MNLEDIHSRAYDRFMYPEAYENVDVGGVVGISNIKPEELPNAKELAESTYGLTKGAIQSELALPDFFESLAMGVYGLVSNPEGRGRLQSFIDGFKKEGIAPDLDKIKMLMKDILPEPTSEGGKASQEIGEFIAPGALIPAMYKAGKKVLKKKSGAVAAPMADTDKKENK